MFKKFQGLLQISQDISETFWVDFPAFDYERQLFCTIHVHIIFYMLYTNNGSMYFWHTQKNSSTSMCILKNWEQGKIPLAKLCRNCTTVGDCFGWMTWLCCIWLFSGKRIKVPWETLPKLDTKVYKAQMQKYIHQFIWCHCDGFCSSSGCSVWHCCSLSGCSV